MIEKKATKCDGINKAKGFSGCGILTLNREHGLCPSCRWDFYHTDERGKIIYHKHFLPKAAKKTVARKKEVVKVMREKIKTKSDYEKDLQKEINQIIKYIDAGWGCIATNSLQGKRNAGHYFSIGSNPTIRFHLENIWNQSEHSNSFKSGDTLRYQDGIIRLYGLEYLERLNRLKMIQPIKLSNDDLKHKTKIARRIVAELKSGNGIYTLSQRVSLRQKFNERIGIYIESERYEKAS